MALETGNWIADLVATNPIGTADKVKTLDDHHRLVKGAIKNSFPGQKFPIASALDTGVGPNAYEITLVPSPPGGYIQFMAVTILPATTNTGACTLKELGIGTVKSIKMLHGGDPPAGAIKAMIPATLVYDGSVFYLLDPVVETVPDTNFILTDDIDPTKRAQFQLSGISTGQTRILTVPNENTTLGGFPSGTRMLFQQTAAPTGWTKELNSNFQNTALRLTTGTVGSRISNDGFLTVFGITATDGHALTVAQIPSHDHDQGTLKGSTVPSASDGAGDSARETNTAGAFNQAISGRTGLTGGGAAHTHPIDLRVNYHDIIIAQKN